MRKILFFLVTSLMLSSLYAKDMVALTQTRFEVSHPKALSALFSAFENVPEALRYFNPKAGAKVSQVKIEGNRVSFIAEKRVLFKNVKVQVGGDIVVKKFTTCPKDVAACFQVDIDLSPSEDFVAKRASFLRMNVYAYELSYDKILLDVKGSFAKGLDYDAFAAAAIPMVMRDQLDAMIDAIRIFIQKQDI